MTNTLFCWHRIAILCGIKKMYDEEIVFFLLFSRQTPKPQEHNKQSIDFMLYFLCPENYLKWREKKKLAIADDECDAT